MTENNRQNYSKDLIKVNEGLKRTLIWTLVSIGSRLIGFREKLFISSGFQIVGWGAVCGMIFALMQKEGNKQVMTDSEKSRLTFINRLFIAVPIVFLAAEMIIKLNIADNERIVLYLNVAYITIYLSMCLAGVKITSDMLKYE